MLARAFPTAVVGNVLVHFRFDETLRPGLAREIASGFVAPKNLIADFKRLTCTAFRAAHDERIAHRATLPTPERLAARESPPPLLVIFGALDNIVPPEHAKLFERVTGTRNVIIDDVCHSPIVDEPKRMLELFDEFLDEPNRSGQFARLSPQFAYLAGITCLSGKHGRTLAHAAGMALRRPDKGRCCHSLRELLVLDREMARGG